jgi:hypothetical protein
MYLQDLLREQARLAAIVAQTLHAVAYLALLDDVDTRFKSPFQQCVTWDNFVRDNKDRPLFRRHLRMSYESFIVLLERIREHINVDNKMGLLRGGKIIPEVHLYATLRYLAGGSYSDICFFCGISVPSFYCIIWRTIHAINHSIKISFPSTPEQCADVAAKFETISHNGVIKNCVGAVDGYLLSIETPSKRYAKNVRSYFSGHYQKYGINIQACCDADCRFTFVGVGGPGVTKDRQGIKESGLFDKVEELPVGYVCIADCAYQPTKNLVPIFGGDLALKEDNDHFNFFALQLRIRIEMAFGLMTRKWGILQRPLTNSLSSIKHIICCIARLHNFCIDERLKTTLMSTTLNTNDTLSTYQLSYMHASAQAEHRAILSEEYPQWSLAREEIVKSIKLQGLKRPVVSRKRKTMTQEGPQALHLCQDAEL